MKRKFVTNLALLLLVNLLVKPFWVFGIDRSIQLTVGEGAYGMYFALFNLSLILNIVLDIGITNYNNRNISQHQFLLSKHFSNLVALKFVLAVVYAIITFTIALIIGYRGAQLTMLIVLVFNQFLVSFILYLRSNITALQKFKTDSLMSVVDRVLMIGICSALLWGNITETEFQIEWFVYAQTVSYLATTILGLVVLCGHIDKLRISLDYIFSRAILKQSFPYALLILLMAFYNRIDSIMIERLLPGGEHDAGIYAQGFRVLDAATMFAFLFAGLLLPIFSYMIKTKEHVGQIVRLSIMLLIVPALILSFSCFFFRHEIINLLYHHNDHYSSNIFGILILGFIPIATTYIFGTLLTANGSMRQLNTMAAIAMAINIGLNLILIPQLQATGAAFVSLTTQLFAALAQVFIAIRVFKFKINKPQVLKFGLFIVIIFVMGLYIAYNKSNFPIKWHYVMAIYIILCVILATIFRIFQPKGLYKIIKYNEQNQVE
ncbi:MAG: polysaccharide biosynthesis C-terminal domain-containing protein [Salinivirgaceae bacterium]|nr:polysaccharide biosynthesis C-terminal domain-containing protein [Salinivirgaceae bacterium]